MDKNNENERSKSLGVEPITNLLMKHSIPAIVGMLVNALYNIVDRVFIGRDVGGVAIGGVFLDATYANYYGICYACWDRRKYLSFNKAWSEKERRS